MTRNVPILDCASDRVKHIFNQSEADRSQEFYSRLIWVVKVIGMEFLHSFL